MRRIINIITLLFIASCAGTVLSGPAVIYNGAYVKALKDQFKLNNTANIMTGTDDPSSVAQDAPKGSLYLRQGAAGELYVKQDDGSSTNWQQSGTVGTLSSLDLTDTPSSYAGEARKVPQVNAGETAMTFEDLLSSDITFPSISGATDTDTYAYLSSMNSAGIVYPEFDGNITSNGDGTAAIALGRAILKTTNAHDGDIVTLDFAAVASLALTDNSMNYVVLDYNSGTPQITASTSDTSNRHSIILMAQIYRDGTTLHINEAVRVYIAGFQDHSWEYHAKVAGYSVESGGAISETGTNNFAVTAGKFWYGMDHFLTSAFDSSGADSFTYYYRDGVGGWTTVAAQSAIDNSKYDDGSGALVALSGTRKGVHWIYMEPDGHTSVVYGRGNYTTTASNDAQPPSDLPPVLQSDNAFIVGKIRIQNGATSLYSVQTVFATNFSTSAAADHNDLSSLQGGTAAEYYHTTSAQHAALVGLGNNFAVTSDGSGNLASSAVTATELGYVSGVTSAVQTQMDTKLENVVEDITPQLGGSLDVNGQSIVSVSNGDITLAPNGSGDVLVVDGTEGTAGYLFTSKDNSGSGEWARPPTGEVNYITANPSGLFDTSGWTESTSGQVDITRTATAADLPREATTATGLKIIGTATATATTNQYVSFAFTLDDADVSKKLKIEWDQKPISGYVAGELDVVIYDGTNEITPSTSDIHEGTHFLSSFDATTSLSYELRIRKPLAAASNGIVISNVIVGPGKIVTGAIVGEWESFTPTGTMTTNTTYTGKKRRVGDSVQLQYLVTTSGIPNSTTLILDLPSGLIIDTNALVQATSSNRSLGLCNKAGAQGFIRYETTTTLRPQFYSDSSTLETGANIDQTNLVSTTLVVNTIAIPIAEWAGSGTTNLGANDVEYVSYDDGNDNDTDDVVGTNYSTAKNKYGIGGSRIPNVAQSVGAVQTRYRVGFQTPIQPTDKIELQFSDNAGVTWHTAGDQSALIQAFSYNNTKWVGADWTAESSTEITVRFAGSGMTLGAAYGSATPGDYTVWPYASDDLWRVVKHRSGIAVGFGAATAEQSGLISKEYDSGWLNIGTLNWGGTDPTSKTYAKYRWTRLGNVISVTWHALYGSAGTSNTDANWSIPSTMPAPSYGSAGATDEYLSYNGSGGLATGVASSTQANGRTEIYSVTSGNFKIYTFDTSQSATIVRGSITYLTDE